MTNNALIAKPVVKNQFWIVTNGKEKVGNVIADGSGFEVKLNGTITHYKNTTAISRQFHIEFQKNKIEKVRKEIPFSEYPTTKNVYNSVLDLNSMDSDHLQLCNMSRCKAVPMCQLC